MYERLRSGQLDFGTYVQQVIAALPAWAVSLLDSLDLTSVAALQHKLSTVSVQASQLVATRALNIGQNTLQFVVSFGVMLYLLSFCCAMARHWEPAFAERFRWRKATNMI